MTEAKLLMYIVGGLDNLRLCKYCPRAPISVMCVEWEVHSQIYKNTIDIWQRQNFIYHQPFSIFAILHYMLNVAKCVKGLHKSFMQLCFSKVFLQTNSNQLHLRHATGVFN